MAGAAGCSWRGGLALTSPASEPDAAEEGGRGAAASAAPVRLGDLSTGIGPPGRGLRRKARNPIVSWR
eukprot:10743791-Lingulodinium_polyedra.AAC.1